MDNGINNLQLWINYYSSFLWYYSAISRKTSFFTSHGLAYGQLFEVVCMDRWTKFISKPSLLLNTYDSESHLWNPWFCDRVLCRRILFPDRALRRKLFQNILNAVHITSFVYHTRYIDNSIRSFNIQTLLRFLYCKKNSLTHRNNKIVQENILIKNFLLAAVSIEIESGFSYLDALVVGWIRKCYICSLKFTLPVHSHEVLRAV